MQRRSTDIESQGFTIPELLTVIVIIGILAALTISAPTGLRKMAADQERQDDIASVARKLEQSYANQALGRPAYPSTVEFMNDTINTTRTLNRLSVDALSAPGSETNSFVIATTPHTGYNTPTAGPLGQPNRPVLNEYVYQPLTANGQVCIGDPSTADPCVSFRLYYRGESDDTVHAIRSIYQQ